MTAVRQSDPSVAPASETFEGDYRPAQAESPGALAALNPQFAGARNIRLEPLQVDFLMRLADALNTTLDLNTLMHRVADLVRAVIDYRIFAILLVNDRTGDLRMRFQTGHTPEVERMRIKLGRGIVGQAAAASGGRSWSRTCARWRTTSTPTPMCSRSSRCR